MPNPDLGSAAHPPAQNDSAAVTGKARRGG